MSRDFREGIRICRFCEFDQLAHPWVHQGIATSFEMDHSYAFNSLTVKLLENRLQQRHGHVVRRSFQIVAQGCRDALRTGQVAQIGSLEVQNRHDLWMKSELGATVVPDGAAFAHARERIFVAQKGFAYMQQFRRVKDSGIETPLQFLEVERSKDE